MPRRRCETARISNATECEKLDTRTYGEDSFDDDRSVAAIAVITT